MASGAKDSFIFHFMNEIDKSYAYKAYEDESLHIYLVYAKIIQQTWILNDFKISWKMEQLKVGSSLPEMLTAEERTNSQSACNLRTVSKYKESKEESKLNIVLSNFMHTPKTKESHAL